MSALEDLRRRWERYRGPRRPGAPDRLAAGPEPGAPRCFAWPERVVVIPADAAAASLPLPPVGRSLPMAHLLGSDGLPTSWAAVEPGSWVLAAGRDAGPLWVQLVHERFRYPAPGVRDLQLGPEGLAGRLVREAHGFELLLVNEDFREVSFRASSPEPWVELEAAEVRVPAGGSRTLRGSLKAGHAPPPGTLGALALSAGDRELPEILVEVGDWAPALDVRLRCQPADLGLVKEAPLPLQVHLSAQAPVKGLLHLGLLPRPLVQEFQLGKGGSLRLDFQVAPDALPRVERGRLRVLAVTDAPRASERTLAAEVPFHRLKLRRNVPRVRLLPSASNPHPHQTVSLRRSDGGPVRLSWRLPAELEPSVGVALDRQGSLVIWCRTQAACEGEIQVLEGETGLHESIPIRVEARKP